MPGKNFGTQREGAKARKIIEERRFGDY